ncbi:indole-3-glycerol phosphate synthase TrpC [Ancylomarina euxinus]|uniref:indole-3-glycerol-phosphate synthase n=1 Tax=Ancylomarina euxinus TaxID=2283627 RepID=A0A425XXD6_9BACT|nr:indole-3-glycerol phosphate synthase TrpC [Ancylomarina euxinus]MCZ4696112.1 indole-3-glycerol phosphate synthase TrpC [Ancylomarina euxinus]MUP16521.1 indole-3-glycerol phosphate synthase TrpC [Ancylomarina euxinus]RRG19331.1 indole-3-glycerol phosphate synthase TrpC [Ancylomarina euxinus]
MHDILRTIIEQKHKEVELLQSQYSINDLKQAQLFSRTCYSAKAAITTDNSSGIISEFKRRSPKKGPINPDVDIKTVVQAYQKANVSVVSVLSDTHFFGAHNDDFMKAREYLNLPLLRKDFLVDPYQIYQSKAMGADLILLIAAILTPKEVEKMSRIAKDLGLEILLEIHDESELKHINPLIDLVGINNRNLKDFSVDLNHSIRLSKQIPDRFVKVAESGIKGEDDIQFLKTNGFQAFLIGEYFMKQGDPGKACSELIQNIAFNN